MMKSNMTALTLAGILSVSSLAAFAQSSSSTPPVDKGGMPPSSEMEAGSKSGANGNALPPGTVGGAATAAMPAAAAPAPARAAVR
ncbi:hypothetical protein [Pseudomonas bijieensis]|uniref:hypothetical protein n=1 Tax=Pseudomonas bijieensis TaxID=2681983 RepID=UPI002D81164E|nr:hypothetical protein [Pseudomonas bijieensis]